MMLEDGTFFFIKNSYSFYRLKVIYSQMNGEMEAATQDQGEIWYNTPNCKKLIKKNLYLAILSLKSNIFA